MHAFAVAAYTVAAVAAVAAVAVVVFAAAVVAVVAAAAVAVAVALVLRWPRCVWCGNVTVLLPPPSHNVLPAGEILLFEGSEFRTVLIHSPNDGAAINAMVATTKVRFP